ncbi:MAG: M14 family zinc carboxypeptidase [bacterium]
MIRTLSSLCLLQFLISATPLIDPRYHTYEEMIHEVDSIVALHPGITKLETLGVSTRDSLPILTIKISDNPAIKEDEPAILFNGIHHAEELLGCEVCLYLLNDLVTKYGVDSAITYWINNTEIYIIPILNPEGHNVVMSGLDTIWRKNKRDNNNNGFFDTDSDGVDLNRNYDFNWALGGSGDPSSENYRGPYPFSENETRIIRDLAQENHFVFDVCYHCVRTGQGELVYYPWRWGTQFSIDHPFIKRIADTLAAKIINDAGNGTYVSMYGYATEGTARNWLYGVCGTFAYTIEVSRSCYPPGYLVDSICKRNLAGAYYLLERTFGSSITGIVTDSITNQPLSAEVRLINYYDSTLAPRMSEPLYGRYRRIVNPGTYSIQFLKSGYQTITFDSIVVLPGIPTTLNAKMQSLRVEENNNLKNEVKTPHLSLPSTIFRNHLYIDYSTGNNDNAELFIYNISGSIVKQWDKERIKQNKRIIWDGNDNKGRRLPSGVYFVQLKCDYFTLSEKILFLK